MSAPAEDISFQESAALLQLTSVHRPDSGGSIGRNRSRNADFLRKGCGDPWDKAQAKLAGMRKEDSYKVQPNGVQALPHECSERDDMGVTLEVNARWQFGVPLKINGPIVEVGGNVGQDLEVFADEYTDSPIFSFEPLPYLVNYLRNYPVVKTSNNRIRIVEAAMGGHNGNVTLFGVPNEKAMNIKGTLPRDYRNEAASEFTNMRAGENSYTAQLVDVNEALGKVAKETGEDPQAFTINCEGCEYEVLGRLVDTPWLGKLKFLQVSWHLPDIPDRLAKHCAIETKLLAAGYVRTYSSYFGWEGWALPCDQTAP